MSPSARHTPRRRMGGYLLLLLALLVFAVAMWGHIRRLNYLAFVLAGLGVWLASRR